MTTVRRTHATLGACWTLVAAVAAAILLLLPAEPLVGQGATGSITIKKNVDDDAFSGLAFDFVFDGSTPFSISEDDAAGFVVTDLPAGNYPVTEVVPTGWDLDTIDCGAGNNNTALSNGLTVVLEAGEDAVCTFNNDRVLPDVVPPVVSKTAFSQVNREIQWRVRKSANVAKAGWDAKDGSVAVRYGVRVVRRLGAPEEPTVFGSVKIENPNQVAIEVTAVEDLLPDATCSQYVPTTPLVVPAGGEQFVGYSCSLSEVPVGTLTNTARVSWSSEGNLGQPVETTADVDFSDPRVQVYGEMAVRVTDTMSGAKTRVLAEQLETSRTFTYTRYLRATDKCRWFGNTARLVVDGGAAEQQVQQVVAPAPEFEVIASDDAGVKICPPPPPPVKPDPTDPKAPPVVIVDNGDGKSPTKVPTKPTDNPVKPVIDSPASKGRLAVAKRADTRRARVGDIVTWRIRVRNVGKADLGKVIVVDRLPAHLRLVDMDTNGTAKARQRNRRVVKVAVGDLLVGQSTTVKVATKVVARPRMNRRVAREASRIRSRQVRVRTLRRARLGVVCNTAIAKAQGTRVRKGTGCVRVLAPVKPTPPPVEENPDPR